jgi:hypothetical protein
METIHFEDISSSDEINSSLEIRTQKPKKKKDSLYLSPIKQLLLSKTNMDTTDRESAIEPRHMDDRMQTEIMATLPQNFDIASIFKKRPLN